MNVKLTKEEFIKKAQEVHDNKYDYSLSNYIYITKKIKIICPIHGEFEQRGWDHLFKKTGCPLCSNQYLKNTAKIRGKKISNTSEEFIKKAKEIHNNKYDYSLSEYINARTKVKIICPVHGVFEQTPADHNYSKCDCPLCSLYNYKEERSSIKEEFIAKAKKIYGDKFDYSLVVYINSQTKVKIICPIHGIFEQKPNTHLSNKFGCRKCYEDSKRDTKEEFITKAQKIHGNKYDYSLVEYINAMIKVKIICPVHGVFEQKPNSHLAGMYGCRKCRSSLGEEKIARLLEINNILFEREKKFNDCKYKNHLFFDFYLPKLNTVIEYNGRQHYVPIDFFGGEERFKQQIEKDLIKEDFCKNKNINFIVIKYDDDIEEFLGEFLKTCVS